MLTLQFGVWVTVNVLMIRLMVVVTHQNYMHVRGPTLYVVNCNQKCVVDHLSLRVGLMNLAILAQLFTPTQPQLTQPLRLLPLVIPSGEIAVVTRAVVCKFLGTP